MFHLVVFSDFPFLLLEAAYVLTDCLNRPRFIKK